MTTFAKSTVGIRWRRSSRMQDRVKLGLLVLIVACVLIFVGVCLRLFAGQNQGEEIKTLSAPSADHGSSVMQVGPVRLGVGAPGNLAISQNAVESILSDSPVSSPALARRVALQRLATTIAEGFPATAQPAVSSFPGVTVMFSGAECFSFLIRESDTGACIPPQAAPGNLYCGRDHA